MDTSEVLEPFPVDMGRLGRYIFWYNFWLLLGMGVITFGVVLPAWLFWILGFGFWYSHRFVGLYSARLQNKRIRISHGVIFQKRKGIPLDRVTDVLISQGFLERRMGICQVRIQTAGTGTHHTAEGVILAIPQHQVDAIQDKIIDARDQYSERST